MARILLCAAISGVVHSALQRAVPFNVEWDSLTAEPGTDEQGKATYKGGMPLGNGKVTVLAWPNITAGGLNMYIGRQDAASDATELFRLGMLQVSLQPNPFNTGPFFNQTLDISTATMLIYAGGTNASTYGVLFSMWVDAMSDVMIIQILSRDPTNVFSISATSYSTRPSTNWTYTVPFFCLPGFSRPDVQLDPIPAGTGFHSGTVIQFHRNNASSEDGIIATTLSQQGLSSIANSTPDWWTSSQFGYALDGGHGPALTRVGPDALASASASSSFQLRVTTLVALAADASVWLDQLEASVQVQDAIPDATRRAEHEAYWASFWGRSHIFVNSSSWSTKGEVPLDKAMENAIPSGAALWLRADDLKTFPDGSSLSTWNDASGNNNNALQTSGVLQPVYVKSAWPGGLPAVLFDSNGTGNYLQGSMALPEAKTVISVFMDMGSVSVCCSGVFYARAGDENSSNGLGTARLSMQDDDDIHANATEVMLDWPGSGETGGVNVNGRPVVAVATYMSDSTTLHLNSCLEVHDVNPRGAASSLFMVGSRDAFEDRFFHGLIAEVLVYPRALNDSERSQVESYLTSKWTIPDLKCKEVPTPAWAISQQYAVARYLQAIQSRGTLWPIKFNGMAFMAKMGSEGEADSRDWGPSNWWQNTRLPYWAMLPAGDIDTFVVILEYYLNMLPFAQARTQEYFNHTGIFFTETKTVFGAFSPQDYGCGNSRPAGFPVWLEDNDYIHLDYGGDGGTPEVALMALDYLLYTGDTAGFTRYFPIVSLAADFFRQHYLNRTADGKYVIWPTQALETWWCAGWDVEHNRPPSDCCVDDMPTVAGLYSLMEKLLALPSQFGTAAQRAEWLTFYNALPALPISADGSKLLSAAVLSSAMHNSETPELYAVHPYRLFTVGRNVSGPGADLTPAINAWLTDSLAYNANTGWTQGIMNAALLGLTDKAASMVISRAQTAPAEGYRFQGFMPHLQDYMPSADHLANFMSAVNWMLLQPADDGFTAGSMVVFPAWPCGWDVSFKLWGPLNTSVSIQYEGGKVLSMTVEPPERAAAVKFANCGSMAD